MDGELTLDWYSKGVQKTELRLLGFGRISLKLRRV